MTAEVRREFSVQSGTGRDLSLRRLSKPSVVALDSRIAMKNIVAALLIFLSFGNDGRGVRQGKGSAKEATKPHRFPCPSLHLCGRPTGGVAANFGARRDARGGAGNRMFPRAARGVCGGSPPANARHAQTRASRCRHSRALVSVAALAAYGHLALSGIQRHYDPPGLTPGFPNSDEKYGRCAPYFSIVRE